MRAMIRLTALLATGAACATTSAPGLAPALAHDHDHATAPADDESGFQVLFDGASSEGWKQAGPGRMVIEDGAARSEGGMGLWYYEKKSYKNFVLRLQYRQPDGKSNSGVFVRFPRVDGDPWIPVKEGYELQIAGSKPDKSGGTGAVYSFKAPDRVPARPAGEWNDYEIKVVGQQYEIRLNGELVNTYTGERATEGMIGLQNHGDKDVVLFRNVRIKELP